MSLGWSLWVHSGEIVPECHSVDHSFSKLYVYYGEIVIECHLVDHSFNKLYVNSVEIVTEHHLVDHSFKKLWVYSGEIVPECHSVDHSLNKPCLLRRDCCWASLSRDCCWASLGPSFMQLAVCLLYLCLSQCCFACLSYIFVYVLTSLYILVCPCSASKKSSTPRTTLGTGRGEGDSESEEEDAIEEEEEIYEAIVSKERPSIVYPDVYTAVTWRECCQCSVKHKTINQSINPRVYFTYFTLWSALTMIPFPYTMVPFNLY